MRMKISFYFHFKSKCSNVEQNHKSIIFCYKTYISSKIRHFNIFCTVYNSLIFGSEQKLKCRLISHAINSENSLPEKMTKTEISCQINFSKLPIHNKKMRASKHRNGHGHAIWHIDSCMIFCNFDGCKNIILDVCRPYEKSKRQPNAHTCSCSTHIDNRNISSCTKLYYIKVLRTETEKIARNYGHQVTYRMLKSNSSSACHLILGR